MSIKTKSAKVKKISISALVTTIILIAFFYAFLIVALRYSFNARIVPIIMSGIGMVLTVVYLLSSIFPKVAAKLQTGYFTTMKMDKKVSESDDEAPVNVELKNTLTIIGWVIGVTICIFLIGFTISTTLGVFLYIKFFRRISWLNSVLVTIGIFVLVYVVFGIAMRMQLFPGILFGGIIT